ncbi:MAG: alpha/beta fold hydrolase [Lautropia sp.]|nr:alpha/beta fold hydrolase [Lautropia sp.]
MSGQRTSDPSPDGNAQSAVSRDGSVSGVVAAGAAVPSSSPARHLVQTDIGTLALKHWMPPGATAPEAAESARGASAYPLVVLVHGMFGDSDVWAATALNLARAGLEVIAFDLPGHGASKTRVASPDETVAALLQALHHFGPRPLLLVGQSFGTLIATRLMSRLNAARNAGFAQDQHADGRASDAAPQLSSFSPSGGAHSGRRPVGVPSSGEADATSPHVAGLVLLSAVGLGTEVNRDFLLGVMSAAEAGDVAALEKAFAALTVRHYRSSPAYMRGLCQRIAAASEQLYVFIDATVDIIGQQRVSLIEDLTNATVPVVLVHGREDGVLPWQQALNAPPQVALHLPEKVGHMPHWEANALVCMLICRAAGL